MPELIKNIDMAKVLDFADLVSYQEGQVVSRTLAQNNALSLTLFAFPPGEGISAHTVPADALVQVLDGEAVVTIDGEKTVLEGLAHKVVPDTVLNKKSEFSLPITVAAAAVQELMYVGACAINAVVPAAVAAATGKYTWKDAGKKAEEGADLTRAIPGTKEKAQQVAELAVRIANDLAD